MCPFFIGGRKNPEMNTLYYGDNLEILKNHIKNKTIDLIYLDPLFQSGKNHNQIFQPQAAGIKGATVQIKAFEDTWQWGKEAEREFNQKERMGKQMILGFVLEKGKEKK
jgi:adenine specific DNA methylase Mod